jgi:hypothetical protein
MHTQRCDVNVYLFVTFALRTCAALFASVSAALGEEVVLPNTTVYNATYHDSTSSDMEDRNAASDDKLVAWVLRDSRLKGTWLTHG